MKNLTAAELVPIPAVPEALVGEPVPLTALLASLHEVHLVPGTHATGRDLSSTLGSGSALSVLRIERVAAGQADVERTFARLKALGLSTTADDTLRGVELRAGEAERRQQLSWTSL
jgi:hypothetical protein